MLPVVCSRSCGFPAAPGRVFLWLLELLDRAGGSRNSSHPLGIPGIPHILWGSRYSSHPLGVTDIPQILWEFQAFLTSSGGSRHSSHLLGIPGIPHIHWEFQEFLRSSGHSRNSSHPLGIPGTPHIHWGWGSAQDKPQTFVLMP